MDCWSLSVTETHPLLSAPHTDVLKKVGWERGTAEPSTLRPLNGVTVAVLPRRPPPHDRFPWQHSGKSVSLQNRLMAGKLW